MITIQKKYLTLFGFFTCISLYIHGQQKRVIPSSPEASSLAKFINFPVDYSTGVPNITIPIFTLQSGQLNLPISISYHAGGLKVNEKSTWVGLGWRLNCEPEISRLVNSQPDESSGYLKAKFYDTHGSYYDQSNSINKVGIGRSILNGSIDRDPDEFYYKLCNGGGKFYFVNNIPSIGFKALPVPYSLVNIQMFQGNNDKATLTDVDGTFYRFGTNLSGELAEELTVSPSPIVTTWKCTEMISPSKKDTIFFKYSSPVTIDDVNFADSYEVYDNTVLKPELTQVYEQQGGRPFAGWHQNDLNSLIYDQNMPYIGATPRIYDFSTASTNGIYTAGRDASNNVIYRKLPNASTLSNGLAIIQTKTIKIQTIKSRAGSIAFYQHQVYANQTATPTNTLDSIRVYNYKGDVIKSIQFFMHNCYDQPAVSSNHPDFMRILDSIYIKDNTGKKVERYAFDYNPAFGMQYGTKRADPWGYYNGDKATYNGVGDNAVPAQIISTINSPYYTFINDDTFDFHSGYTLPITIGSSNNGVNSAASQAWMLKQISYPTGGRTQFEYEQNQVMNGVAGGLRIRSIKYFADNGSSATMEKHYRYGKNESGWGYEKSVREPSDYSYQQTQLYIDPIVPNLRSGGRGGESTTFQFKNTWITERKTTYTMASMKQMSFSSGTPVVYSDVSEYQIDNGLKTGKTIYKYFYDDRATDYRMLVGNLSAKSTEWPWGQLLSKTDYAYSNGNFVWVNREESDYYTFLCPEEIRVLKAFNFNSYRVYPGFYSSAQDDFDQSSILLFGYVLGSGSKLISKHTSSSRDFRDTLHTIVNTIQYFYDNKQSLFPTRISRTDSKGNIITKYITHANDYSTAEPSVNALQQANQLSSEIENVTTLQKLGETTTKIVSAYLSTYALDGTGYKLTDQQIEPSSPIDLTRFKFSQTTKGTLPQNDSIRNTLIPDSSYRLSNQYTYDIRGNITQIIKNNVDTTSYLWDYNNIYPIAECRSAPLSQFAYTSFEDASNGGWTYQNSNFMGASRTGLKFGIVNSNPITKSGLNSNGVYYVSYWSNKSIPYTITGTVGTPSVIKSVSNNTWFYFVHKIKGQSIINITGNGYIDELRLFPEGGQLTTYTYKPLVGISSLTDSKGETLYYIYDNIQRLIGICDQEGNFVKRFNYHYTHE